MYAIDLHTHTRFFHGHAELGRRFDPVGVRLLARMARLRGLDAIVTTNHDYYRAFDGVDGVEVVPGIEVTTTKGHLLIVGPDPPDRTDPGTLTPHEAVALAHERDCAAIIAHPFRNSTVRTVDAAFDAVEINGKGTESYDWVQRLASERDLPLVAGSDAHYPIEVGRAFTVVEEPAEAAAGGVAAGASEQPSAAAAETATRTDGTVPTPEQVVAAIRDGRVRAYVDKRPSQRLLRAAYRLVHARKGWIERPQSQSKPVPPGIGTPPGERENAP